MAVTTTTILAGANTFIFDITATADADVTTGNVPHGLGAAPLEVSLTMLQVLATTAIPSWAVTTKDATNIVCQKTTGVGSGVAGAQVRCRVALPHSIVK